MDRAANIEMHGVDHANDRHVDRGIRASDCCHGRTFGNQQHPVTNAGIDGIQRQYRSTAVAAVQIKRRTTRILRP